MWDNPPHSIHNCVVLCVVCNALYKNNCPERFFDTRVKTKAVVIDHSTRLAFRGKAWVFDDNLIVECVIYSVELAWEQLIYPCQNLSQQGWYKSLQYFQCHPGEITCTYWIIIKLIKYLFNVTTYYQLYIMMQLISNI